MTKVVFPCDQDTWWLVKDRLHNLKDMCLQNCDLTVIAEAHQALVNINLGQGETTGSYGNCLFYGLVKYYRKQAPAEDRIHFLTIVLPQIIELALKVEFLLPEEGITINRQQKGEIRHIDRHLCCSILACGFLCLFPNEQRGFKTKLNIINFNKFFANLPIPSQIAKLQCILHFFERVTSEWDRLTGSITFSRQVLKWEELPTLDTWLNCSTALCPLQVCPTGVIEDAGPHCLEVDFANRYIGGGVLGRGRVQEEIRFTMCPELIVSMLFMEVMEDNEAILISGYEQFAATLGYAADLRYAGSYLDKSKYSVEDKCERALCAINAVSYRHDPSGLGREQYEDGHMLRDINKAFIGFCMPFSAPRGSSSEEEFLTAEEEEEETSDDSGHDSSSKYKIGRHEMQQIDRFVEQLLQEAIAVALPEVAANYVPTVSQDVCSSTTPRSDSSAECTAHTLPGISEEEAPMTHLEVNFRDWYAQYRRRSSNLSDLSSRRSSYDLASRRSSMCSQRGYSSEFSSEFEDYYDNFMVQEQKYKYHTIKEEVGTSVITEFAMSLAASLLREGTFEAVQKDAGVQEFRSDLPENVAKPRPCRASAERDTENNESTVVSEETARKFVGSMFATIWPFMDTSAEIDVQCESVEKAEVLTRIMEGCSSIPNTLQNSDNELDKTGSDSHSSTDLEDQLQQDAITHVEGVGFVIRDENVLVDIADRIVTLALEEGLAEYKYLYMCNQPRKFVTQISSESSQSEHSIEFKDQSELRRRSPAHQADLLNKSANNSVACDTPAVTVAENLLSEIFKPDHVGRRIACPIPVIAPCDNDTYSIVPPGQQYETHSRDKSDIRTHDLQLQEKNVEMYNKIAERLLRTDLTPRTHVEPDPTDADSSNVECKKVLSAYEFHRHSEPSCTQPVSCKHRSGVDTEASPVSVSELPKAVIQQPVSEDEAAMSYQASHSRIFANRSPVNLDTCLEYSVLGEKPYSRTSSDKSSRLSDKRSSSSSSEGKISLNHTNCSLSVHSARDLDRKDGCDKISPENSSTNHSTASDKNGSESPVPKFKLPESKFSTSPENWLGARPKTNLKGKNAHHHHQHHVVGSKKNYDQFANSLSRDLLTNAFLQVQEHSENVSYPRRSSEPMQISNGAALQRLENSVHICNGKRTQKSKTDEDLREFEKNWLQDCNFRDLGYGRNSSGFRDPLLSRFAEELMKANVSIPQLHLLPDCVSTSGSSRSVCSTISSFKDPLLASFEEELLSQGPLKSAAKTQMSWSKMKVSLCSPRLSDRQSSQISNYVGSSNHGNSNHGSSNYGGGSSNYGNSSVGSQKQRVNSISVNSEASVSSVKSNRSFSASMCSREVSDYADSLARRILCEAFVATVCRDSETGNNRRSRMTLDIFSDMLADTIIQSAMKNMNNNKLCSDWLEQNKMSHGPIVTWSDETECLEYSGGEEVMSSDTDMDGVSQRSSTESSSQEFEDCLDVPYRRLEEFADLLASRVLFNSRAVIKRENNSALRKRYGRPIATGNWGCGAFRGNPQLKALLQWMAASYAGVPSVIFYTFNHDNMVKFQDVIDTVNYRGWDVAQLMQAVRRYCITTENEIRLTGAATRQLFDVILQGEVFPGT